MGTPGMEFASLGHLRQFRDIPRMAASLFALLKARQWTPEAPCRMDGAAFQKCLHRVILKDPAGIHNADPVTEPLHNIQIVGNEYHGHSVTGDKPLKETDDLATPLPRRGQLRGLIGNDKRGVAGNGDGDEHPLPLASAQLVGILETFFLRLIKTHLREKLGSVRVSAYVKGLFDGLRWSPRSAPDPENRIKGRHGLLKDHTNATASYIFHLKIGEGQQIPSRK